MTAPPGSIHDRYRVFAHDLAQCETRDATAKVFFRMARSFGATAAALIEKQIAGPCARHHNTTRIVAAIGPKSFWADYVQLCEAGDDIVTRTLRISPHSLALSDLQSHPRLTQRITALKDVLAEHHLNDLFAVPGLGRATPQTLAILAGRDFDLRRSKRHLKSRMTVDVLARLTKVAPLPAGPSDAEKAPLTRRQFEIAHWLVAGKTDWEIGEILQISPKTVNYHVENMKRAYGVHSRSQFIAAIVHEGGIAPSARPMAS